MESCLRRRLRNARRRQLGRKDISSAMLDDPSIVTVLSHFDDADQAQAFVQSPDMVNAVQASGVIGEPEVFFFGYEEKYVD